MCWGRCDAVSGHSKWATIKRKKEATDAKRSNMYAKLLRAVEVAAREGGGSVEGNMTLASAVEKAKGFSVPNDNIDRAIKRGTGELGDGQRYEEVVYEGYAPGGIALLIEALTDNRNRTAQEVRHAFTRHGGSLGETGSVAWQFTRKGVIVVDKAAAPDEESLLELSLDGGAEDLTDSESSWDIVTAPQDFKAAQEALLAAGVQVSSAELSMLPRSTIAVAGSEATQVLRLIDALEDLDDVQSVYANFDIPEEVMAAL
jgi:YebC/PmpR family DNA-binding regulatory protein